MQQNFEYGYLTNIHFLCKGDKIMCKNCKPNRKYWLHIADNWSKYEKEEMWEYLNNILEIV